MAFGVKLDEYSYFYLYFSKKNTNTATTVFMKFHFFLHLFKKPSLFLNFTFIWVQCFLAFHSVPLICLHIFSMAKLFNYCHFIMWFNIGKPSTSSLLFMIKIFLAILTCLVSDKVLYLFFSIFLEVYFYFNEDSFEFMD